MTREEFVEKASDYHLAGYNCAQAVACAMTDQTDLTEDQLFAATEGLGLGMGGMQGTCGAISGACVAAGFLSSTRHLEKPDSKKATYAVAKELTSRYKDAVGSVTCAEIKGQTGGPVLKPCHECVRTGAGIAYDVLIAGRAS